MHQSRRHTQWPETHFDESEPDLARSNYPHPDPEAEPPTTDQRPMRPSEKTQISQTDDMRHVKWGITLRIPFLVLCSFLASISTALGHHFFYLGFNNAVVRSTEEQTWAIRIGTGLAFLNKTFLVAIMGMISTQQIWVTLRRKFMTLHGIDSMFQIMTDPTAIFDSQLWTRAKTLLLLAVMSWFIPLVAVVTPATLSVRSSMESRIASTTVPTVNFSNLTGWATYEGAGRIDSPRLEMSRLFAAVTSSVSYVPLTAQYPNSSYGLSFWAPSYKCLNFSDAVAQQSSAAIMQKAWQDNIEPQLANAYKAAAPSTLNNTILIWSGGGNYSALDQSKNVLGSPPTTVGTSLLCQLYNTSYDVSIRFDQGVQSIIPRSIRYLHPHSWTSSRGGLSFMDKEESIGTAYVTHLLFKYLLTGNVSVGPAGTMLTSTRGTILPFLQSGLIGCPDFWNSTAMGMIDGAKYPDFYNCRNRTLAAAIEDLSRNFTYSTMASSYQRGPYTTKVPVTITYPQNLYSYDSRNLVLAYLASLLVVLLWMGVGGAALWSNGITSSVSFSTIMLTTRSIDLDTLAEGNSLGADPLPKHIADTRLMFGCLDSDESSKHAGFGFKETVTPIQRGEILR